MLLPGLICAAETNQRLPPGFFRGHPALKILFNRQLQVSRQFRIQFALQMRATKNRADTVQ
jgi:hypothetical protein